MKLRLIVASAATLLLASAISANAQQMNNPTAERVAAARKANFCEDPWITIAIWTDSGGMDKPNGFGQLGECRKELYNGGQWGSFAELFKHVQATRAAIRQQGASFSLRDNGGNTLALITRAANGMEIKEIIAGRLVSQDGGSIVATGGGNLVSHDGGSIVATGGGNYSVQSAGRATITLPGGRVLVLNK